MKPPSPVSWSLVHAPSRSNRIRSNRIDSARLVALPLFSSLSALHVLRVASHWIILALAAQPHWLMQNSAHSTVLRLLQALDPLSLTVASLHSIIFIHRNSKHFDTFRSRIDFHSCVSMAQTRIEFFDPSTDSAAPPYAYWFFGPISQR